MNHHDMEPIVKACNEIYQHIGADIPHATLTDEVVEICFDADRLKMHDIEVYELWLKMIAEYGYTESLQILAEKVLR